MEIEENFGKFLNIEVYIYFLNLIGFIGNGVGVVMKTFFW
jgi:hypothetical protein